MKLTRLELLSSGILEILILMANFAILYMHYPMAGGKQKIPLGVFKCVRGIHKLHSANHTFETFEITGAEGHTNLLFHPGNTEEDSEGCILLGTVHEGGSIFHSRDAFEEFMKSLEGLKEFELEIIKGDLK